ncbi:MAG TPA: zinc-ribbon domain-containing protein [Steroidobacteraceae bacterium]|nr:zinc-ribbon domain-containing protein [Steroidobacteraceae bacterium]
MALLKCSECGRTISDKAKSCVGCGAPLKSATNPAQQKIFNLAPEPDRRPPPGRQTLMWRAILSTAAFVAGVVWSGTTGNSNRPAAIIAGLLVIVGLCGAIVTAVQFPWTRK